MKIILKKVTNCDWGSQSSTETANTICFGEDLTRNWKNYGLGGVIVGLKQGVNYHVRTLINLNESRRSSTSGSVTVGEVPEE